MADDDDEWRFSVDEVGPDDEGEGSERSPSDAVAETDGERDARGVTVGENDDGPTVRVGGSEGVGEEGGNVAGTLSPKAPVEPGTPEFENVVFATIGAVFTALVFAGLLGVDPETTGVIVGAIVVAAGVLYAVFRRF
ncbi:MAG: hypothetical protein V5A44_01670 [Haloarculaceae archaeon]